MPFLQVSSRQDTDTGCKDWAKPHSEGKHSPVWVLPPRNLLLAISASWMAWQGWRVPPFSYPTTAPLLGPTPTLLWH